MFAYAIKNIKNIGKFFFGSKDIQKIALVSPDISTLAIDIKKDENITQAEAEIASVIASDQSIVDGSYDDIKDLKVDSKKSKKTVKVIKSKIPWGKFIPTNKWITSQSKKYSISVEDIEDMVSRANLIALSGKDINWYVMIKEAKKNYATLPQHTRRIFFTGHEAVLAITKSVDFRIDMSQEIKNMRVECQKILPLLKANYTVTEISEKISLGKSQIYQYIDDIRNNKVFADYHN